MSTTEAWTELLSKRIFLYDHIPIHSVYRSLPTPDRIKHPQKAMSIYANTPWSGSDNLTPLGIEWKGGREQPLLSPEQRRSILGAALDLQTEALSFISTDGIDKYVLMIGWMKCIRRPCVYLIKRHFGRVSMQSGPIETLNVAVVVKKRIWGWNLRAKDINLYI